jgi:hypothetical protein
MLKSIPFIALIAMAAAPGWLPANDPAAEPPAVGGQPSIQAHADLFRQPELKPAGEYYQATAPDTLDLAERRRLAVRGLINFGDPQRSHENYQIGFFNAQPAWMSHFGAVGCNWGKLAESLLMARAMCGSTELLAEEEEYFQGILALINDKGEFALDASQSWCKDTQPNDSLIAANTSRMLLAFLVQNQLRPSPRLTQLIVRMAEKFTNALRDPKYWVPEVAPKAAVPSEHGQFTGHLHSYLQALMGMLGYAELTNDARLKEFVRESYEYARGFGIARIGMYSEMCATGDMTWLAIKLSDLGVGDYWEDVDQNVRNQLVEAQVTDPDEMHKVNATMPKLVRGAAKGAKLQLGEVNLVAPVYAAMGLTDDHVIDRCVGVWRSDANNPAMTYPQNFIYVVCCSGNCPSAMYSAWEATLRCDDGVAQVNLLLNRASPWLDMDSYLPYEGKVVIRNKTARQLSVRVPRWVDQGHVGLEVKGTRRPRHWLGRYLLVDALQPKDEIHITFPMVESKETYTLMWKPESRWLEGIDPGPKWTPAETPDRYTFLMKGNTLVDVSPRPEGPSGADTMLLGSRNSLSNGVVVP